MSTEDYVPQPLEVMSNLRIVRLKMGDWSFGHAGSHHGFGSADCPRKLHHHHDEFCAAPTPFELHEAGIDQDEFKLRSRAGWLRNRGGVGARKLPGVATQGSLAQEVAAQGRNDLPDP